MYLTLLNDVTIIVIFIVIIIIIIIIIIMKINATTPLFEKYRFLIELIINWIL